MKQIVLGITIVAVLVVAGRTAGAQGMQGMPGMGQGMGMMPADHAAVEKALMANEEKVNAAFAKRDVAGMKMFIADDAMAQDMSGPMPVAEFLKQLPTMDVKITEQSSSNFKYTWVDANTVVVAYTWTGKGTYMGQPVPSPVYSSTVWTKRGAKWVAVFHQETAAMAMKK